MAYNDALKDLHKSIVSPDASLAAGLVREKEKISAAKQIAIYADAYRIRLQQAVRSDYPCLAHFMDEALLTRLIRDFVETTPSLSYNLDVYPHGFWSFIQKNSPDIAMGELSELEGAIATTFMTKGNEPLTADNLPPLDATSLGATRFELRTPHRLLSFTHDVEAAMISFKKGDAAGSITPKPIYLYLYRLNNEVQRVYVEEGEYHLLNALQTTENFNGAIQHVLENTDTNEDVIASGIARWLPRWITLGFLSLPAA